MKISKVGLFSNDSPRAIELAIGSVHYLGESVEEIQIEEHLLEAIGKVDEELGSTCKPLDLEKGNIDLALVFGGDGTILRAVAALDRKDVPVFGVNMGRMGFLSQVEPKDLNSSLDRLMSDDFEICHRMKLDVSLNGEHLGSALNELLVQGDRIGKIFRGRVGFGDLGDLLFEGDGIVVSTPTGSTGHSLSTGGSVVDCELDAIIMAPLGALTPARPLVISADKEVVIDPGGKCAMAIDGELVAKADQGMEIRINRSESRATFIIFDSDSFWKKLRQRIGG
jgi:NAD+ kinase